MAGVVEVLWASLSGVVLGVQSYFRGKIFRRFLGFHYFEEYVRAV